MKPALISCICVTRNRPRLLMRALHCFDTQTYPHKELILVLEAEDLHSATVVQTWNKKNDKPATIISVAADSGHKLGALRNLGITEAHGQYFCQWDDDDWYHPQRLTRQYEHLAAAGKSCLASVLEQWIIFDAPQLRSYLSCRRHWEGSILCDRNFALEFKYENLEKGEDTPLVAALAGRRQIQPIAGHAWLYIYTYHGANTWDIAHFKGFMRYSCPLATAENEGVIQLLQHNNEIPLTFLEKIH